MSVNAVGSGTDFNHLYIPSTEHSTSVTDAQ